MLEFTISNYQDLKEFNEAVSEGSISILNVDFNVLTIDYSGTPATVVIDNRLLSEVNYGLDETTRLIYGKCPQKHIVNISFKDEQIHIFIENEKGIVCHQIPYKHWALSSFSSKATKPLKGNTHYKYIRYYDTYAQFLERKNDLYKYKCYLVNHVPEAFQQLNGFTYFKALQPNEISILSFDIETSGLNAYARNAKVFLITNTFRSRTGELTRKTFNIDNYKDQNQMIVEWCDWVREIDPSILCGHNITIFDIPYLKTQTKAGILLLGRDGSNIEIEERPRQIRKDGSQSYTYNRITIFGREICDTFFLSLKYDIKREFPSYGLKPIIKHLGLEKQGRTFIDASKIEEYWKDPVMKAKVIQYAEEDADDSLKLYDHMISALFYFTQYIPKSLQFMIESATGSQINSFLIRSYLQKGYSIPKATDITEPIKGGISFAVPGIYRNVLKIDLKSAYPSQVLRFKLYDPQKDPDGNYYKMVEHFTLSRFEFKRLGKETGDQKNKDRDGASKIFINSAYGVCTTPGLNFNNPEIGAKITLETRMIIDMALKWASGEGAEYWIDKFKKSIGKEEENVETE